MGLTTAIAALSIVAFIISFFQVLAKPEADRKQWSKLVAFATLLLIVNITVEVGKRRVEKARDDQASQRQAVMQQKQAEQLALTAQVHSDVQALNKTAAAAFDRLERIVTTLPRASAVALTDEARLLQAQLRTVADVSARAVQDGTFPELRTLVQRTQAHIQRLNASMDMKIQEAKQIKDGQSPPAANVGEQPVETRPLRDSPGALNDRPMMPTSAGAISSPGPAPIAYVPQSATPAQAPTPTREELIEAAGFAPTGWMGDATSKGSVQFEAHDPVGPHSPPDSQRWTYIPDRAGSGWAAIAWQFPASNWGDKPGKDWSTRGFTRVTVWARGRRNSRGSLPRVQFKAGGCTTPGRKYAASFEVDGGFVTLTEEWNLYSLDLKGKNLSQVIAAFVLVFEGGASDGETVFLDDITYR